MTNDKQAQGFPLTAYYYDKQIYSYILQFMAIFAGLQVMVGKLDTGQTTDIVDCDGDVIGQNSVYKDARLIQVPLHYGSQDRVVASIFADNTQNKLLHVPMMSAYLRDLRSDPSLYVGTGTERRYTYMPRGGLFPDDLKVNYQLRPTPYMMTMELALYASNTSQYLQMIEQILILFNPDIQIQRSDGLFDMAKLSKVTLTSISQETNYPSMTDRRIIQTVLQFEMPIQIATPVDVRDNYIKQIFARIGIVDNMSQSPADIIAEMDQNNVPYDLIATADDLSIK